MNKTVLVSLTEAEWQRLARAAFERNRTMSQVAAQLLARSLESHPAPPDGKHYVLDGVSLRMIDKPSALVPPRKPKASEKQRALDELNRIKKECRAVQLDRDATEEQILAADKRLAQAVVRYNNAVGSGGP